MGGTESGPKRQGAEWLSAKRGAQVAVVASKQLPVVGCGVRGPFEVELRGARGRLLIGEYGVQRICETRRR